MVIVLMRCLADPPRLKADHVTFLKKVEAELCGQLVEVPAHIVGNFHISDKERLMEAVYFLLNLRLATKVGMSSKSMNLVISELGHKWLNSSTEKKLATICAGLRDARTKSRIAYINTFKFSPRPIPLVVNRGDFEPSDHLVGAFSSLKPEEYITFDSFIDLQVKSNNPLARIAEKSGLASITIGHDHFVRTDAELAVIWADYLKAFLFSRLFALGGATFGTDDNGQLAFSINEAGCYLLGCTETFSYDSAGSDKILIVQPDFDIIFLAPSPAVESKIIPFAERVGSGIGVLFKITRKSIMHGASVEMSVDDILSTLTQHSMQPLSGNVESEIRGWFNQCSYIEGREAYIVKCPDYSAMMRVLELAGNMVTPLSETVLELNDSHKKVTFHKLMKDNGVFLR